MRYLLVLRKSFLWDQMSLLIFHLLSFFHQSLEYAAFEGTLSIDSADGVSAVLLDLSATAEGEDAIGVQLGIASITDGEFAEFTSPESFVSLRDVVKNVASLYYTSIASYEEPSEEFPLSLQINYAGFPYLTHTQEADSRKWISLFVIFNTLG